MAFEQPGVANIRERKAARDERWRREQNGEEESVPQKGSIEYLVCMARQNQTPEQREEFARRRKEGLAALEEESRKRATCSECGVDTRKYSHTFRCYWRGIC